MSIDELKKEDDKLNMTQKLSLVEDIWDSIADDNSQLPLSEWQKTELNKRYEEYKKGGIESFGWKEVHDELRKKLK